MKIAIVRKKYSLAAGGAERYTVLLARELSGMGHEVHLFANIWDEDPGIRFHHVPMLRTSPGKNLSFALFSHNRLSGMEFDVIHSMERIWYQDIFRVSDGINPIQLFQRYPNPFIRKIKGLGPRRLVLSYLEKRIFLRGGCRVIMTNSKLLKEHIMSYYHVHPKKIVVVYNSVDTLRFNPGVRQQYRTSIREQHGIGEAETVLLFISNNFKLKGLRIIIEAMAMSGKSYKLIVVGNDNAEPYVRWAARTGLDKQLIFMGPVKEVERYYGAADIFVLPTAYDAFANVCLEAMACGLPVITTGTNGAAELIRDRENGYVLKSGHPDELAGRLAALESESVRSEMGAMNASEAARYTMGQHIARVSELYDKVRTRQILMAG